MQPNLWLRASYRVPGRGCPFRTPANRVHRAIASGAADCHDDRCRSGRAQDREVALDRVGVPEATDTQCDNVLTRAKAIHAFGSLPRNIHLLVLCSGNLQPDTRHARHRPTPPQPRPDRSRPPQRRPLARPRHRRRQSPQLPQRAEARPRRPGALRAGGRSPLRAGGADRPPDRRVRSRERNRGPAGEAHGDRVLEERARRADRGRPVRRRAQAPPAAGRLRVGDSRPADDLRP